MDKTKTIMNLGVFFFLNTSKFDNGHAGKNTLYVDTKILNDQR